MKRSDVELMRYHDLESDSEESRRVERRLLSDEDARERLAWLERGSHAVRAWGEGLAVADVADQVMDRIERERSTRARTVRRQRWVSWSVLGSGLAAAACLWLWIGHGGVDSRGPEPTPVATLPVAAPPVAQAPLAEIGAGVAIEKLDFGANSGSIFVVQGSNVATPVVWLSDSEGDQAKMEPL